MLRYKLWISHPDIDDYSVSAPHIMDQFEDVEITDRNFVADPVAVLAFVRDHEVCFVWDYPYVGIRDVHAMVPIGVTLILLFLI